jgi:hypothetical protein
MESNSLPSPSFSSGGDCLPASSAGFIYWKFMWRAVPCLLPPSPVCQSAPPSWLCVFFSSLFIIQFLFIYFFVGQGLVCPGGYAGLSQGWLREYCVLLICSPVGLHLPSIFGAGIWWHGSLPGFSV